MSGVHFRSALEAGRAIAAGKITSEQLVTSCLDRIVARENSVQAWEYLDVAQAIEAARLCDSKAPRSLLHGVPVGLKDVIDTAGIPTCYGSSIYAGHRPVADASCVALLKAAGMIVLGKTVTTEFAYRQPGKTRNPLNLDHTPGGSSSGSAAAVADGMVPLAIGTQTGGSVIRPASYCGVVGFKPTFGAINRAGVKPLAESIDTIGVFARDVADAACLAQILAGHNPTNPIERPGSSLSIGICRTPAWDAAEPSTHAALDHAAKRFAQAGAKISEFNLTGAFADISTSYRIIQSYEGWRALAYEREVHGDRLSDTIKTALKPGGECTRELYVKALDIAAECRSLFKDQMRGLDILITPSAPGEAPRGHSDIGNSVFNSCWTLVGAPCITLPGLLGAHSLPIGIQVIGPVSADNVTLSFALWASDVLSSS